MGVEAMHFLALLLLLFNQFFLQTQAFDCPNGWTAVPGQDDCIAAFVEPKLYIDAFRYCSSFAGFTANLKNIYDNAFALVLTSAFNGQPAYIGVERKANNSWVFSDGQPLTYLNWDTNEPMITDKSFCAVMSPTTGKWQSSDCNVARPFLCSMSAQDTTTTTLAPFQTTHIDSECLPGWKYYEKTGSCYYLHNFTYPDGVHWQLYDWFDAETGCQSLNSHLVSIHSKDEGDFVYALVASNVSNDPIAAPNNYSCGYYAAFIGFYGYSNGTGTWLDRSSDGYSGFDDNGYETTGPWFWVISNDQSCKERQWRYTDHFHSFARFVCKMPGKTSRTDTPTSTSSDKLETTSFTSVPQDPHCPIGWRFYEGTSFCYYLQDFFYPMDGYIWKLYNQATAEANCQQMGGHLISIHSEGENDFIYELVASNVRNFSHFVAPGANPCGYQAAWIGLYGGIRHGVTFGNWTDDSPVDFFDSHYNNDVYFGDYERWTIQNDHSCDEDEVVYHNWGYTSYDSSIFARFVCKAPSKER